MPFVADASVTLPWCFEDEATEWTESLLDRLGQGERIHVPAHWVTEVSNALLMATRRMRIDRERAENFFDRLTALHIVIEQPLSFLQAKSILHLSVQFDLTFYDAAYLELAQRLNLSLATLDRELRRAAGTDRLEPFLSGKR